MIVVRDKAVLRRIVLQKDFVKLVDRQPDGPKAARIRGRLVIRAMKLRYTVVQLHCGEDGWPDKIKWDWSKKVCL